MRIGTYIIQQTYFNFSLPSAYNVQYLIEDNEKFLLLNTESGILKMIF